MALIPPVTFFVRREYWLFDDVESPICFIVLVAYQVRGDSLPLVQYALGREVGRKSRMRDFEGAPARRDTGVWAGLILGIDRLTLCRGWCLLRLTDIFVFAVFCFFRPLFSDAVARRIGSSEGCNRERG